MCTKQDMGDYVFCDFTLKEQKKWSKISKCRMIIVLVSFKLDMNDHINGEV
jgi:hypothetical protein